MKYSEVATSDSRNHLSESYSAVSRGGKAITKSTILIAEDDFMIREGLLKYLLEPNFIVVAVDNGRDVLAAAEERKPVIALFDIRLPGVNGLEAARQLLQAQPTCKVLFVSGYAERPYVDEARAMGASGYVLKTRLQYELLLAIDTVLAGDFYESKF